MSARDVGSDLTPSQLIDDQIADLGGWRGETLAWFRHVVFEADSAITEEWKWSTAVWAHDGLVCAAAAFKGHVKFNFFHGALLDDPTDLFNAGLDAKVTRAIDVRKGDRIDASALRDLIRAAVAQNTAEGT
jgi:hypothetical protein